jgi:transcriptional regulator with XRE-family HTH domain
MPRTVQSTAKRQKSNLMKQAKNLDKHVRARRADLRDAEVGRRVRSRRLECRLSQTELADRIGVTFQQVQKYERGASRVSVGRLQKIADMLDTPITFFYGTKKQHQDDGLALIQSKGAIRLLRAYAGISSGTTKHALVILTEALRNKDRDSC